MNLIASLVNASGWRTIKKTRTTSNCGPEECNLPTSGSQNKGTKRHLNTDEQVEHEKCKQQKRDGNRCNKRAVNAQADNNVLVKRRCRGKQADPNKDAAAQGSDRVKKILQRQNKTSVRGRPKGSTKPDDGKIDRSGKMLSISVWKKMEIIHEYERLKKLGTIKNVGAFMRKNGKLKGGYQGCLSKTKWLGSREKYKWDLFCKYAPKLAKQVHEVPNALLDVLGVEAHC